MSSELTSLLKSPKSTAQSQPPPKRRRFSLASTIPIVLVGGFVLLVWLLFGDRLQTGVPVQTTTVVTLRSSADASTHTQQPTGDPYAAETLFQASGWVEPAPFPIRATALYNGIVEEVYVLEGETVEQGQLLATLIAEDAQLDLQTAQAQLGDRRADVERFEALVEATRADLATLALEIEVEQARLQELQDDAKRLSEAGRDLVLEREIEQKRLQVSTQEIVIKSKQSQRQELQAQLKAQQAAVTQAKHRVALAQTELERRQLALSRTEIRSPIDGIIQKLFVAPGMKRMAQMDGEDSATIAKLYDPQKLQARIDVPLEEAAQLAPGQPVILRTNLLPNETFQGAVTRTEGHADIQRNTLQAKVVILNPSPLLRPDMLCRAEFKPLGTATPETGAPATTDGRVTVYVPESALLSAGNNPQVWVVDESGERVTLRDLTLSPEKRDDHRKVIEGLRPGDQVVLNPPADLQAGERIQANKKDY